MAKNARLLWLESPLQSYLQIFLFSHFPPQASPKDLREQKLSAAQKDKLNKHDWALTTKTTTK